MNYADQTAFPGSAAASPTITVTESSFFTGRPNTDTADAARNRAIITEALLDEATIRQLTWSGEVARQRRGRRIRSARLSSAGSFASIDTPVTPAPTEQCNGGAIHLLS
jgi:hypothetical protein